MCGETCLHGFGGGLNLSATNAANNAFKRAVYGMIDFYMEEEADLRRHAAETNMDNKTLETKLDELWGKVTLYNCYQFFVQLTSKKLKNPLNVMSQELKQNEDKYKKMPVDEYNEMIEKCEKEAKLWQDKPEADLMTLYFNATAKLPQSLCRNLVMNADNALRSIGGAEKMLSSVYGIAVTAMVRFVGIYQLK